MGSSFPSKHSFPVLSHTPLGRPPSDAIQEFPGLWKISSPYSYRLDRSSRLSSGDLAGIPVVSRQGRRG